MWSTTSLTKTFNRKAAISGEDLFRNSHHSMVACGKSFILTHTFWKTLLWRCCPFPSQAQKNNSVVFANACCLCFPWTATKGGVDEVVLAFFPFRPSSILWVDLREFFEPPIFGNKRLKQRNDLVGDEMGWSCIEIMKVDTTTDQYRSILRRCHYWNECRRHDRSFIINTTDHQYEVVLSSKVVTILVSYRYCGLWTPCLLLNRCPLLRWLIGEVNWKKKKRSEQRQMKTLEDGGYFFGMLLQRTFRWTVGRARSPRKEQSIKEQNVHWFIVWFVFWVF